MASGLAAQREKSSWAEISSNKGIAPIVSTASFALSSSRAVVIGISDYLDPPIPDMRFADRDAAALAAYLHSPAGGARPPENFKLLTNKAATTGASPPTCPRSLPMK